MMRSLDKVLELVQDSHWHSFDQIKKETSLPADKLNKVFRFLQEQAFVDKKNGKLRIKPRGLKFLELPS